MSAELVISELTVSYGAVEALHDVSLSVRAGEIAALVGSNGAGKSTTLKAIAGLVPRVRGSIKVAGQEIAPRPGAALREGVALSPEGRRLFPRLTVEENLLMGAFTVGNRKLIRDTMDRVYGYFPRLKERRRQLAGLMSGGEQQMAAIGRALMACPKILLLDEPSLGIAPIIVQEIGRIIQEINAGTGMTILLVEQNAQMALSLSSNGFVLESGVVTVRGTGRELLASKEIQEAYLGM